MSTISEAHTLKTALETALGDAVDLVTLDGRGVKPSMRAVVIFAPTVTFPTFGERDTQWKIYAVSGPADRPLAAWETLDLMLDRLESAGINLAKAEPAAMNLAGNGTLPAYEITLNPS